MTRLLSVLSVCALIAAGTAAWIWAFNEGDNDVKADFTILLDEPIARDGGAVILLPTPRAGIEATDAIQDAQIKTELRTGGQVSVIRLYYPEDSTYVYRFRSADDRKFPNARLSSERLLVGSSTGIHPDTSETEDIPTVLIHHIEVAGGKWTKSRTRVARTETDLGFLTERYACDVTDHAIVCDATPKEATQ